MSATKVGAPGRQRGSGRLEWCRFCAKGMVTLDGSEMCQRCAGPIPMPVAAEPCPLCRYGLGAWLRPGVRRCHRCSVDVELGTGRVSEDPLALFAECRFGVAS